MLGLCLGRHGLGFSLLKSFWHLSHQAAELPILHNPPPSFPLKLLCLRYIFFVDVHENVSGWLLIGSQSSFRRSGELANDYESRKQQMSKAEEETNFSLNKKKVVLLSF